MLLACSANALKNIYELNPEECKNMRKLYLSNSLMNSNITDDISLQIFIADSINLNTQEFPITLFYYPEN